jgi:type II secretory pathway component GspD/PulD (secretin)
MKRIAIATLMSLAIPLLCLAQQTNTQSSQNHGKQPVMVTRTFDVLPTVNEKIETAASEAGIATAKRDTVFVTAQSEEDLREGENRRWNRWKDFFHTMGVEWPEGSSLRYIPSIGIGKLVVTNAEENMRKVEEILIALNVLPSQIEIEAQFVEYKFADIAALTKQGGVTQLALMNLWHEGNANLLYAPKVVTQSGQEAIIKNVKEVIYPADILAQSATGSNTNTNVTNSPSTTSGPFWTRDAGLILKVTPEVSMEGTIIYLTISPEIVGEPTWKIYKGIFSDKDGKSQQVEIEEPSFFTQAFTASVSVKNGKTVMAGGGMMNRTNDKMVYCFVTARLVDLEGNPIKSPDSADTDSQKSVKK